MDNTVVPVINDENELVGVITTNDLLKTIGNLPAPTKLAASLCWKWNAASLPFQRSRDRKVMMQPSFI
ncbi:MAG: hypothetical protein IPI54_17645 [Chitinophagaceae bacterium]|nr:hypothetical protein [Chitinophagaceae bacterium]